MSEAINKPLNLNLNSFQLAEGWAIIVMDKWVQALIKYNIGITRELQKSFEHQLVMHDGDVDAVIFKFLKYGRFDDMGVGRGQDLNGIVMNRKFDRYRDAEGKMTGKLIRKKKPWYTKTFYREVAKLTRLYQEQYGDKLIQVFETAMTGSLNLPT